MKNNQLIIALLCTLLCTLSACKKDTSSKESLATANNAPNWVAPKDYDLSSSMTAIVKVDLSLEDPDNQDNLRPSITDYEVNESDLLAAFCDGICLGVTHPIDDRFYLYIASPADNGEPDIFHVITLRYYSTTLKKIFEAPDVLAYQTDAHIGTYNEPFMPIFTAAQP